MPLIVLTGFPSSGKSKRALELKKYFEEHSKEVHIISEFDQIVKANFEKNAFYADSNKEKHIRGLLKSEMLKLITPNNVVILDALNYIKGYRYELFCGTKANKSLQCTVYCCINIENAWIFNENRENTNEKYNKSTFDALIMRYEEPDKKNRWDAPLHVIYPDNNLDTDKIYSDLFKKAPPKPNMSTQNPPLSETNFLYDLDQVTKKVIDEIIEVKNDKMADEFRDKNTNLRIDVDKINVPTIMNLRRQFITYSKMNTPDSKNVRTLFLQYLATSLK